MSNTTVMVVEDDEALRESVCELLEDVGFTPLAFENGKTALERLRTVPEKPAVILLDLMMPGMNGWQFRDEQLKDPAIRRIPVVVMTASRDLRDIAADDVVYKPLKLDQLLEVVHKHSPAGAEPHSRAPRSAPPPSSVGTGPTPLEAGLRRGGGEMGALVRNKDWSSTPLGPITSWPRSLQLAASLCLASRYQVILFWGRELIQIYNDAFIAIAGGKHPKALGQGARECWPEMWDTIAPLYEHVFATGTATRSDDLHLPVERHGYLEESFYTMSYTPVFLETGEVGGVFNVILETTVQVVAERRTRTMRDLARRTAEAKSPEAACTLSARALDDNADVRFALFYLCDDATATLRWVAAAGVAEASQASPRELPAAANGPWPFRAALEELRPIDVTDVSSRFGSLATGPWGHPVETAMVLPLTRLGEGRPWGVIVLGLTPQRAMNDEFRSFVHQVASHVATAVGAAHAYEEERSRAEALAQIDHAKTVFFSNVSHEFRTPLTLMLGPTEDLLAGAYGELDGAVREQLELVHRNEVRLHKLVQALLDFARIEAGRLEASFEPVDLPALTADLASAFRSAVERSGLGLDVHCPPLGEPVFVDRDLWEKIVLNLLSNALKFTFEGRISVALARHEKRAVLTVSDTGVGIAEANLERVFERFHRIEGTPARTHEGSGIGLSLVQEFTKLHGGNVQVSSKLGVGTTFTVAIPLGVAHLDAERLRSTGPGRTLAIDATPYVTEALRWLPETSPRARPASDPPPGLEERPGSSPGARILLADDNADMRDYVRRLLESRWTVEAVADGEAALCAARSNPPDLVLADVMMPRLDGFGLLQALRSHEATRTIPVVLVSARAGEEALVEGLSAGADDYVTKPFSARELIARVSSQLELQRLRRQLQLRQEQLLSALMRAPAVVCVLRGPELVYEMANDLYRAVMGRRELVGKPMLEALPELAGQDLVERLREVLRTGEPLVGRERLARLDRSGDGTLEDSYWNFVYTPLQSVDGQARVVVIEYDVTDQVVARRLAEESESRFRALVDQVEAGIAEVDLSGRFTFANERFREIVGRSAQELLQAHVRDITHPDDLDATLDGLRRVMERGAPFFIEKRYVRPDGSIVWVQKSYARVQDDEGRPRGVALAAVDTTRRKYAEQALEESEQRSRQRAARVGRLQRATERLASTLSSDEVAQVFIEVSRDIIGATATAVYFTDPSSGELRLVGSRGVPDEALAEFSVLPRDPPTPLATAIASRRAVWIETNAEYRAAYPQLAQNARSHEVGALAAVPLLQGDLVLGGVVVTFERPRRFDEEDRHWLTTLAAQCVVAAERVRLYQGEQSARLEAETLLRIAEALGTSQRDLDSLVQRVTDEATTLIGAKFGALFYNLTRPDGESYVLYTLSGAPREAFASFGLPRNTPLFGATFRGEAPVRLDDVTQDPRYGQMSPHHGMPKGHLPVTSYLAVPVVARSGTVLGGLFFGHPEPARFTEAHERLVKAIATNAAVAIENAQLFRASREAEAAQERRARRATFASEVGAAFTRGGEVNGVLQSCCDLGVQHLHLAVVRIWVQRDATPLELIGSAGALGPIDALGQAPPDRSGVEFVAQRRRAHASNDVTNDPRCADADWARREGLVAFAGYPLVVEGELLGVFTVFARHELSSDAIAALESVAQTIAIGIQRMRADEDRARLLAELRRTVQFSETFVGILGHDLRNPLGAIVTTTDLLIRRESSERVARPLERIRTSAGRMERMIAQILDFTRARIGGGIPIRPTPVDLERLAAQLVEELEDAAARRIATSARGKLSGEWDEDRLAQVVSNLLGNAVEHGETGAPIRLDLDGTAAEVVRISIANAGAIAPSDMPTLFDPFRRAAGPSKQRRARGLGLGLYIVQQVVQAHGGRIEAHSSPGEGVSFLVELPRRTSPYRGAAASAPRAFSGTGENP